MLSRREIGFELGCVGADGEGFVGLEREGLACGGGEVELTGQGGEDGLMLGLRVSDVPCKWREKTYLDG